MNVAQQALARGTALLAKQSPQSEEFTFGSAKVWANCNRTPIRDDPQGGMAASTEEGSVIEWPLDATPFPQRGDVLVDSFGYSHRVGPTKHIGHAIQLTCEVVR